MTQQSQVELSEVKDVLVDVLCLDDRADSVTAETRLLGAIPELDSMAVVELLVALERRFGIAIADRDIDEEMFATLGSLTEALRAIGE